MATTQQLKDLSHFIETLPPVEREALSIDEIYGRWRDQAFREEDFLEIQSAVQNFQNGDRGRPFSDFIAEFKAERQEKK